MGVLELLPCLLATTDVQEPDRFEYLRHLVFWIGPFIVLQWVIGWKILRRNLRAVVGPTVIAGVYYSVADSFAIRSGLWFFGEGQTLGWELGNVPFEEALFFVLTALLVAQSVVLLLPQRLRR